MRKLKSSKTNYIIVSNIIHEKNNEHTLLYYHGMLWNNPVADIKDELVIDSYSGAPGWITEGYETEAKAKRALQHFIKTNGIKLWDFSVPYDAIKFKVVKCIFNWYEEE